MVPAKRKWFNEPHRIQLLRQCPCQGGTIWQSLWDYKRKCPNRSSEHQQRDCIRLSHVLLRWQHTVMCFGVMPMLKTLFFLNQAAEMWLKKCVFSQIFSGSNSQYLYSTYTPVSLGCPLPLTSFEDPLNSLFTVWSLSKFLKKVFTLAKYFFLQHINFTCWHIINSLTGTCGTSSWLFNLQATWCKKNQMFTLKGEAVIVSINSLMK